MKAEVESEKQGIENIKKMLSDERDDLKQRKIELESQNLDIDITKGRIRMAMDELEEKKAENVKFNLSRMFQDNVIVFCTTMV